MSKKINILFDGNYLFHSEFSIFSGWNGSGAFKTEKDEVQFLQGVANKFFYALNHLPKGGNVIFTIDSRSWRKAVDIPGHPGYKSGRQDEEGNKKGFDEETAAKFFGLMDEFGKHLSRVGIIVSRIGGAEGDDLIYRWTERLWNMNESCLVVSGDKDLTQLCKMEGDKWIIQWNNKKNSKRNTNTFYIPKNWRKNWLKSDDEASIFNFDIASEKEDLLKLIRDQQITLLEVNPDEVILNKILAGDDGDDVPPVWIADTFTKKGKPTTVRMTGQKPGKAMDSLCETFDIERDNLLSLWENEDFMDECAGLVLRLTKDKDGYSERHQVIEAMKRNAQLVWLREEELPFNLLAEMDLHIDKMLATNETERHKWNRQGLFEGSRFDESAIPDQHDPFHGMDIDFSDMPPLE